MSDKTKIIAFDKPIGGDPVQCLIDSEQSVAEAFPDLSDQVEVDVNGRLVPKEEYSDCIFSADDTVTMIRMPAGGGDGGGKNILRTAALLAVTIGATIISGGALAPLGISALAGTAIGAGVAIGGSLLVNTLIPPPDIRSAGSETEAFQRRGALTGSRNQLAPYAPIPRVYGHMRMFPPMSAKPYTEIVGNQQYLRLLFNLGPGPLSLSKPKIGDTEIGSFDGNNNFTSNGTYEDIEIDIAESPQLYSQDVDQQDVGVPLAGSNDNAIRTTVAGTDEASIDIVFPGGLFGINTDGDIVQRTVGFTLEYRAVGDSQWLSTNGYKTTTQCGQGRLNQRPVRIDDWDDCSQVQTNDPVPYYIRNEAKETYRSGIAFDLPDNGQYEIRLTRLTPAGNDDQSQGTVYSDLATWTALRSIKTERPTDLPGTVQIGMRIKATDQLNGILDEFNVEAKSRLAYYDGTDWDVPTFNPSTGSGSGGKVTSNPAWILADLFAGKQNQQAVDYSMLDADGFKYWADTFGEDFQYNSVIDSSATVHQLANNIAAAGRASWGIQDGKYRPILDEAGQSPIQMFTPRNSNSFSASKTFPDELHGLKMKFRNSNNGWKEDEAIVYQDGYSKDGTNCRFDDDSGMCKVARKFTEVQLDGVTSWEQAWRLGRYKLAERILRPEVFTYKADIEQLRCQRGDVVFMASDVTLWGSTWGRLKQVQRNGSNEVTGLVLDQPVIMQAGRPYNIRIRQENGGFTLLSVQTDESQTDTITIDSPESANINAGDLFTFGEAGEDAVPLKIINIRPGNNLTATLTLVDRADAIHAADQGAIPEYDSNITEPTEFDNTTPPVPIIDSVRSDDNSLYKDEDGTYRLRMLVSFSIRSGNQTTEIEARFRAAGSREGWIGLFRADANLGVVSLPDVTKGKDYIIQLRGRYKNNVSEWTEFATNHTVQGKQQRPPNVTGFNAAVDKTQIRLTWNPVDETDNEQYEVRTENANWGVQNSGFVDRSKRTKMTDDINTSGQISYWIKAIDTSGNYSQSAAVASVFIDPKYVDDPVYEGDGSFLERDFSNVADWTPADNRFANVFGDTFTGPVTFDEHISFADGRVQGDGGGSIEVLDSSGTNNGILRVDRIIVNELEVGEEIDQTNKSELFVKDQYVKVNAGQTGTPSLNGGLYVERGDQPDAYNYFDEGMDRWGTKFAPAGTFDPFILESDIFPDGDYQNLGSEDDVEFDHLTADRASIEGDLFNRASTYEHQIVTKGAVQENARHEIRIPWPNEESGPIILDVTVLTDTNSVFTESYITKRYYLTAFQYYDAGIISKQVAYVTDNLSPDEANRNYLSDFREDTTNGEIVADMITGHNRQVTIKLTAFGGNQDDYVSSLINSASFHNNVETGVTVPDFQPVETPPTADYLVHNNLTVGGDTELRGELDVLGDTILQGTADVQDTLTAQTDAFFGTQDGHTIGSPDFISQVRDWRITKDGRGDVRYWYADELRVKAFTADVSQAFRGSRILTKSFGELASSFEVPSAVGETGQLHVADVEGFDGLNVFQDGDYILVKIIDRPDGGLVVAEAWGQVSSPTAGGDGTQTWTFTLKDAGNADSTGMTAQKGTEAISFGTPSDPVGFIQDTVLDQGNSPYSQVVTWAGNPWDRTNWTVQTREGNLAGISLNGQNLDGFGAFFRDNLYVELAGGGAYFGKGADGAGDDGLYFDEGNYWLAGRGFKVTVGDKQLTQHLDDLNDAISTTDGNVAGIQSQVNTNTGNISSIGSSLTGLESDIGTIGARSVIYANTAGKLASIDLLSGDTGSAINIAADQVNIDGTTTFTAGYDPSEKETPQGAQAKADAVRDDALVDRGEFPENATDWNEVQAPGLYKTNLADSELLNAPPAKAFGQLIVQKSQRTVVQKYRSDKPDGKEFIRITYNRTDDTRWKPWVESESTAGAQAKADQAKDDARNTLAGKLGYSDYDQMVAEAEAGRSFIKGGRFNTILLEATTIASKNGNLLFDLDSGQMQAHKFSLDAPNLLLDSQANRAKFGDGDTFLDWNDGTLKASLDELDVTINASNRIIANSGGVDVRATDFTLNADGLSLSSSDGLNIGGGGIIGNLDGSGQVANGSIKWNAAGNAFFKKTIDVGETGNVSIDPEPAGGIPTATPVDGSDRSYNNGNPYKVYDNNAQNEVGRTPLYTPLSDGVAVYEFEYRVYVTQEVEQFKLVSYVDSAPIGTNLDGAVFSSKVRTDVGPTGGSYITVRDTIVTAVEAGQDIYAEGGWRAISGGEIDKIEVYITSKEYLPKITITEDGIYSSNVTGIAERIGVGGSSESQNILSAPIADWDDLTGNPFTDSDPSDFLTGIPSSYVQSGDSPSFDSINLPKKDLGDGGIGDGIDFGSAGIYRVQQSNDPDGSGLAFYTHPSATAGDPQTLALTLSKFGNADFKESLSRAGNTVWDAGNLSSPIQTGDNAILGGLTLNLNSKYLAINNADESKAGIRFADTQNQSEFFDIAFDASGGNAHMGVQGDESLSFYGSLVRFSKEVEFTDGIALNDSLGKASLGGSGLTIDRFISYVRTESAGQELRLRSNEISFYNQDNDNRVAEFSGNGDSRFYGNVRANDFITVSDRRLKSEISPLADPFGRIDSIDPSSYRKDGRAELGVIAQDVAETSPELVHSDPEGMLSVSYNGIATLALAGVKSNRQKIQQLEQEIERLKNGN